MPARDSGPIQREHRPRVERILMRLPANAIGSKQDSHGAFFFGAEDVVVVVVAAVLVVAVVSAGGFGPTSA